METRHARVSSLTSRVLHIRSGIPSFDQILSGGIPLGTLMLIEETQSNDISSSFSKAFLGEGAVNQEFLFVYSEVQDQNAVPDIRRIGNSSVQGNLTVRYETYAINSEVREPYAIDLSSKKDDYKRLVQRTLEFSIEDCYHNLWSYIKNDIKAACNNTATTSAKRIHIKSMFSLRWPQQSLSGIFEFLKSVKTLLRSQNAVCLITAPLRKMSENLKQLVLNSCDLVILTRPADETERTKIVIYKAPKCLKIEESSSYTVLQSQGTTVLESI